MELHRGEETLDTLHVFAEGPTITELEQDDTTDSGEVAIRWDATTPNSDTDEDGAGLVHQVYYSNDDGKSWRLVASGLERTNWSAQEGELPGGEKCKIQIRTTDGFNVDIRTSEAFAVATNKPHVAIIAPRGGHTYLSGAGVLLMGQAFDKEDQILPSANLHWLSDRQGDLGAGRKLVVRNLEIGTHRVTLEAVDKSGATSRSEPIEIVIEARP